MPLPADDLIARCRRVYAECETYADEGEQVATIGSFANPSERMVETRSKLRTESRAMLLLQPVTPDTERTS